MIMNYWLCADTHFGHRKLVDDGHRPDGFEGLILKKLIYSLSPGDVLIHLGDLFLGKDGKRHCEIFNSLSRKFRTWLLLGNHDSESMSWYLSHGWDWVGGSMVMHVYGRQVTLTHEPVSVFAGVNIHGHLHTGGHRGDIPTDSSHILISQELLDYRPITLKQAVELGRTPMWRRDRFIRYEESNVVCPQS